LQWLPEKATPVGTVFWRCCFEASLYSGTVHKKAENDCSGNSEVIFFFLRKQQQRSSTLIGAQSIQSETITYCGILDTKKRRNRIKPLSFEHCGCTQFGRMSRVAVFQVMSARACTTRSL